MRLLGTRDTADSTSRRRSDGFDSTWRPRWFVGLAVATLCVVLVLVLPSETFAWNAVYRGATAVALLAFVLIALRMPRRVRGVWWSLLAFQVLTVVADTVYDIEYIDQSTSFPGTADVLFLVAYVPVLVALGLLIRGLHPGRDREAWIDSVILSVAAASIVGAFLIAPALADSGLTGLPLLVAIAYPFLDLLVLCCLVWLIAGGGRPNPALMLLVLSFALYLVGDVIRDTTLADGIDEATWGWLEALHLAGLLIMALAAAAPGARWVSANEQDGSSRITRARILAMAVGVVTVPILVAIRITGGPSAVNAVLAIAAVMIILLTIWRIALLVRQVENERRITEFVLDSTGDGIIGLDRDGLVAFANLSARRMLRCREEDLVGQRFHDIAHHHHADGTPFAWEDCPVDALVMSGGVGTIQGQTYFRRDGSAFPVEIVVSPLMRDGVLTGSVTSFRDVSERQAVAEVQRQFVSVVSHELRTPLTSIKGSLQMLDSGLFGEVNSEQQELLTMAVNNSDRLSHLVNDILDLERLDAGRMPLHPQPVSAYELAEQAVSGITGAADAAGISVTAQEAPPGATAVVDVDAHRILQVLTNLLGNAIKFSERGSAVRTEVTSEGDMVRICVIDEGRGIPVDQLARVFERFGQVESGDARRHDGSGLGLAIAREIAVRSGGTIEVTSEVGVGSRFAVLLPSVRAGGVA